MAFKKEFQGDGSPHSATYEAEKWLADNGYSVGSGCVTGPMGIVKGKGVCIAKWRNLTSGEQASLDGRLYTSRQGPASLILKEAPTTEQPDPSL